MTSGSKPRRVLLLVEHAANRRVLAGWLEADPTLLVVDEGDETSDLVLVDGAGLARRRQELVDLRESVAPLFLPCVFITPRREVGMITADLWRVADEVVTTPISPEELRVRIERLLITRLHSLELHSDATELRRSNTDLERFASVVAHELRSPLSAVYGSVETIRARNRDALGSSAVLLDEAAAACLRMRDLMENLIAYARTDNSNAFEPVELSPVVDEVLGELQNAIDESHAHISVDPLPVVAGDAIQLGILFQNLISNAIKYRRPGAEPHVDVSVERLGARWHFCIADDGVGIDESADSSLFEIFARGARTADRAGSGIGLAICRRIVEGHGGRIWFERRDAAGTRFCFELPAS